MDFRNFVSTELIDVPRLSPGWAFEDTGGLQPEYAAEFSSDRPPALLILACDRVTETSEPEVVAFKGSHFAVEGHMRRRVLGFVTIPILTLATLMIAAATLWAPTACASEFGSRDEAIAMVQRVQEMYRRAGMDATIQAIRSKSKAFFDRDLYAYILDLNGVVMANGAVPAVQGKDISEFRDQNGKFLVKEEIEICKGPGRGWVDFRWVNPMTKIVEDKSAYLERLGPYCTGVGIYRDEQVNSNTVAIISGSPSSDDTYLQMAYDLAAVLNDADNLRILPVVGIGGPQNIRDVRSLKGIDLGLTQTSILNSFRRSNEQLGSFDNKIVYVTKLFNEETHIVVRNNITSLEQLQGQKVNLDATGSGTSYSMRDVFKRLNIKVEEVSLTQAEAFEKLKRGEIAATVLIAGKPARSMTLLKGTDGLHFLSIPYTATLGADYLPTTLNHDEYPELIPAGQSVDTIAVGAVLIAYNWPKNTERYRRVEKFIQAFFPRITDFQRPPNHVKWREVNLASTLPGWNRFEPAETWINAHRNPGAPDAQRTQFSEFLATRGVRDNDNPADTEQLFQEFLKWNRAHDNRQ